MSSSIRDAIFDTLLRSGYYRIKWTVVEGKTIDEVWCRPDGTDKITLVWGE